MAEKLGYAADYHRFIKSTKVTVHPNYILSRSDEEYEIAIVETNNVLFNQYSNRMPIYDGHLGANHNMLAIGWGVPSLEDQTMNTLLKGVLTMSGNKTLCKDYIDNFVDNNGPQICSPVAVTPYHSSLHG
ncbi:hypothetical protein GGF37_002692 [Kickxella alabastrina]|nr:hypothetical protein GGF37_002692 [Kickxella alabastrina]